MQDDAAKSVVGGEDWPKRLVFWLSIAATVFLSFWYRLDIILLAFAGALLAIILHACADWLDLHTPRMISHRLSYAMIVLGIVLMACLIGYLVVPSAISEASQIAQIIPKSLAQITAFLNQRGWGRYIVRAAHNQMTSANEGQQISVVTSGIEEAIEGAVVILVVGFYGALYARGYVVGLLDLVPKRNRLRVAQVSQAIVFTLRWWLIGQLIPMFVLGVSTAVALWLLGIPMAFVLGFLTGAMVFIPYVGAWIAFVPTALVSLTRGPDTLIYVTILYLAIHIAEGYVLVPLVQKRAVLLPPVITILSQLFMWKVAGLLGVAMATPIAAALLVMVKTVYLHEEIAL
ncbi:MAG TPA: AI-2E family transporter [Terriglobia bacterium]|nr:AI-2E family transporter [Terriglobia bacterium]